MVCDLCRLQAELDAIQRERMQEQRQFEQQKLQLAAQLDALQSKMGGVGGGMGVGMGGMGGMGHGLGMGMGPMGGIGGGMVSHVPMLHQQPPAHMAGPQPPYSAPGQQQGRYQQQLYDPTSQYMQRVPAQQQAPQQLGTHASSAPGGPIVPVDGGLGGDAYSGRFSQHGPASHGGQSPRRRQPGLGLEGRTDADIMSFVAAAGPGAILESEERERLIKSEYQSEMVLMRQEIEKLTQLQQLERVKNAVEREKSELQEQTEHERWLNSRKRALKEVRVRKALAKELGVDALDLDAHLDSMVHKPASAASKPVQVGQSPAGAVSAEAADAVAARQQSDMVIGPGTAIHAATVTAPVAASGERTVYLPANGFRVEFDFLRNLPTHISSIQVAYCFYRGGSPASQVHNMRPSPCITEAAQTLSAAQDDMLPRSCIVGIHRTFKDVTASEDVTLVVEVKDVSGYVAS